MPSNLDLPVKVGDTIQVAEPDYLYGVGMLKLRITQIFGVSQHTDGAWLNVRGVQLYPNGNEGGERNAAVRFSVLAQAKRAGR
jgi:hypothetical protein